MSVLGEFNYDILVFFSPMGIKSLKENFPKFKQGDVCIACFGPTTAKAVRDAGLRLDLEVPNPTATSMPAALEQFIKKMNKQK
jgi:uroporphyrinogen-III synthase